MSFAAADRAFQADVGPELVDHWGDGGYASRVVRHGGKHWLVKFAPRGCGAREVLASALGRGWLNVPEVRRIDPQRLRELARRLPGLDPGRDDVWLVRLAQDHRIDELPLRTLAEAVAGELVFSLWIRRRDAHAFNRALVGGVPLFFDFGAAFDAEPENVSLDRFMRGGPDPGFVGNWRLLPLREGEPLDLVRLRATERGRPLTLHPVRHRLPFERAIDHCVARIGAIPADAWRAELARLGLDAAGSARLDRLLLASQRSLGDAVGRMRELLARPWNARARSPVSTTGSD